MIRILLIEADEACALHLNVVTGGENAEHMALERVATLAAGQARLVQGGVDLVLSALELPDSSGLRTLLRLQTQSPEVAVVVIGNASEEELGRKAVEHGAQDFLSRGAVGPGALRRLLTSAAARQRRLNALRGREDLVRSLTTMNADGIIIIDEGGVVRFANPAAERLLAPRAAVGEPFGFPVEPDMPAELELPGGRFIEVRSAAIRWKGRPGLLASLRDVTGRKKDEVDLRRARDAAEDASRAKSDFVAHMSHEIRTPINSILGMTEVLAETVLAADQRECVEVLQRSGDLLLHLVNNILDLSKIEAGALDLERAEFDLFAEAEKVASTLDYPARKKGLTLVRRFDPRLAPRRRGDAARLGQVLVNLLANAVKFTDAGSVTLALEPDAERVLFSVSDTGIGIPPEKTALIFESFRQADSSVTRRHGGTGLGLAISRRLVEAMGGELRLESALGRGSRFFFSLPLEALAGAPEAKAAAESAPAAERPMRILLVDDSPDNRLLVRRYLKDAPHAVTEAVDGREAVAKFGAGGWDLVFMDVQMPELDGLSATREIRRQEALRGLPRVPVVALTASVAKEDVRDCREAGCDGYLAKPVRKADLLAAVRTAGASPAAPVEVRPDADVADLVPAYIENRARDLAAMAGALERGDLAACAALAHTIRGSAANFGLEGLGELCREVEEAARRGDLESARAARGRAAGYLDRVRLVT
ncbi:MAG: response regulator [Elusimicrobia bacterium]|nr:response regulator [Elusimicrobiota bacterium]